MAVQILDIKNKAVGEIQLSDMVSEKVNKAVLYYAIKANLNGLRHGTASTKTRSEVNKTNKKIYRQKGTGSARHGPRSANIFVGGGVVHGPKPRSYNEKVNRGFKKVSYQEVLKHLIQNNALKVFNELKFDKASTKKAAEILNNLKITKALVILPQDNKNAQLSFRNIKNVKVINENNINVYELIKFENLIVTTDSFNRIKERYSL